MVKLVRDILIRQDLRNVQNKSLGYKIKYFWNKGWEEMPEIMIFLAPCILSIFPAAYVLRKQYEETYKLPRYFDDYTVLRPNNPNVSRLRTEEHISIQQP